MSKHQDKHADSHGHSKGNIPLEQIKQKELELRGKYLESKKQAEIIVSDARKKAGEIRRLAIERSNKEAKDYYDRELLKVKSEVNASGKEDVASTVNATAEKNFSKACDFLYKSIALEN